MPPEDMANTISIDQGVIINTLNMYFLSNNLPFEMNQGGICNALATLHAKYVLADAEVEFTDILQRISTGEFLDDNEDDTHKIDRFVVEVLLCFKPEIFNKQLSQKTSMQALEINGKPLSSSYNLALLTSDDNWAQIIKELNFTEDDMVRVGSPSHVVSLKRNTDLSYTVYDPNYKQGFKTFKNEKELIAELHTNVFRYHTNNMGLELSVIRHPEAKARAFPSSTRFINQYINAENINECGITHSDSQFYVLSQAAMIGDIDGVRALLTLKPNDEQIQKAAISAVICSSVDACEVLFPKLDNASYIFVYLAAAKHGRSEIFNYLGGEDPNYEQAIDFFIQSEDTDMSLLRLAAEGGSSDVLASVLSAYSMISLADGLVAVILKQDQAGEDSVTKAIKSGSCKSAELLMDTLADEEHRLSEGQKLNYLVQAIKYNQATVVSYLIEQVPKASVARITLNSQAIKSTQLGILLTLKDNGVNFGAKGNADIEKRQGNAITLSLGRRVRILLTTFRDFCIAKLGSTSAANYDVKSARFFSSKNSNSQEHNNNAPSPSPTIIPGQEYQNTS